LIRIDYALEEFWLSKRRNYRPGDPTTRATWSGDGRGFGPPGRLL